MDMFPYLEPDWVVYSTLDSKTSVDACSGGENISPTFLVIPDRIRQNKYKIGIPHSMSPHFHDLIDFGTSPSPKSTDESLFFQSERDNDVLRSTIRDLLSRCRMAHGNDDVGWLLCLKPSILPAYEMYLKLLEDDRQKNMVIQVLDGTE